MKRLRVPLCLQTSCPYNEAIESRIEEENGCVYHYIVDSRTAETAVIPCWLFNTVKAPKKFKVRDMKKGRPSPMMRVFCDHPAGMTPPPPDTLEVFWTESYAALSSNGEILAVVTDYLSPDKAESYTRHALLLSPYGAPLKELPSQIVEQLNQNGYRF